MRSNETVEQKEQQLILERIRASDYDAFEEVHDRYFERLFQLAGKKLGDADEAYDLVQELFIELWEKRDGLVINNPLFNYLSNGVWFRLSMHFRKKGFTEKHLEAFAGMLKIDAEITVQDEEELLLLGSQYETLLAAIDTAVAAMPSRMREVFNLSRAGDRSITEIAEQLAISPKTVSNQLNMAFDRIRRTAGKTGLPAFELLILLYLTKS